jgi:Uma2 family endonuclease
MNAVMQDDWISRHRITVDEYYRMAEVGLLAPEARVELIEGVIIDMAPIGSRHGGTVVRLNRLLSRAVGDRAVVLVQHPVRLNNLSEPQPDLAVVKPRADDYTGAHPTGADTLLIVEVSETSFRYDRQIKVPLYAEHKIPEVWIVDLKSGQIHFFRVPAPGGYEDVSATGGPGVIALAALSVEVDLSGVLSA